MCEAIWEDVLAAVRDEVEATLAGVAEAEVLALAEALLAARRVFVTGQGRSGLVASCFAMRLAQVGLESHVVGETTAPPARAGDVLLAVSSSGTTEVTLARRELAQRLGMTVALVTGLAERAPAQADLVVTIPQAPSVQCGGSRFEQATLLLLDALVLLLQRRLGQRAEDAQARHATLE